MGSQGRESNCFQILGVSGMQSLWSVLWSTGKSTTVCPSEESPLTKSQSSTKAFFERISDQDPEGCPLTYPAWQRNSLNKKLTQRQARGAMFKKVRRSRSPPILGVHSTHQDVTHFERAQASREQCRHME